MISNTHYLILEDILAQTYNCNTRSGELLPQVHVNHTQVCFSRINTEV